VGKSQIKQILIPGWGVRKVIRMVKLSAQTSAKSNERLKFRSSALPPFQYKDGYTLSASDLGKLGVKIELNNEYEHGMAIILPPGQVGECGRWLLGTLEQDSNGLPKQLCEILERLSGQKGMKLNLRRGDKKKLKEALKVLKSHKSKARPPEPVLRSYSTKAERKSFYR
jgi:hypothetical protein